MNRVILGRLLWKEFRQYRALLVVAVCSAAAAFGLAMVSAATSGRPVDGETMFLISFVVAIVYALGCSATMFAAEHDHNTFEFLRLLPQAPRQQVLAKGMFVLTSTAALVTTLGLAAFALIGGRLDGLGSDIPWSQCLLSLVEVIAWGCLFSQLIRHPLIAVVATVAAAGIFPLVVLRGAATLTSTELMRGDPAYLAWRVASVALLIGVDVQLGRYWFRDTLFRPWRETKSTELPASDVPQRRFSPIVVATGRLVWQEWRQQRWLITWTLGSALAFWGVLVISSLVSIGGLPSLFIPLAILPAVAAVAGSSVFFGDQWKQRYRFFAEQGISARQVWWTRQLVWGSVVACWAALAIAVYSIVLWRGMEPSISRWTSPPYSGVPTRDSRLLIAEISAQSLVFPWGMAGLALVAYAAGQLSSLFLRSGVLGFFGGLAAGWFVGLWVYFSSWLDIPPLIGVVPFVAMAFWATWLRAPSWMIDADQRRNWTTPCLAALVGIVVTLGGSALYRVYQIPPVELPRSIQNALVLPPPDGDETGRLYQEAFRLYTPYVAGEDGTITQLRNREDAFQQFLQASRRETCRIDRRNSAGPKSFEWLDQLADCVVADARMEQDAGRSGEALERLMALRRFSRHLVQHSVSSTFVAAARTEGVCSRAIVAWAARQTEPDVIRQARREWSETRIESLDRRLAAITSGPASLLAAVDFDPHALQLATDDPVTVTRVLQWMPWERARIKRIVRYQAAQSLQVGRHHSVAMDSLLYERWDQSSLVPLNVSFPELAAVQDHQPEQLQHAVDVRLALLAYRAAHGELPARLADLDASRERIDVLSPIDQSAFIYRPRGVSFRFSVSTRTHSKSISNFRQRDIETIEPGTPLLWWAGPLLYCKVDPPPSDDEPLVRLGYDRWTRVSDQPGRPWIPIASEEELWRLGVIYPIPVLTE